MRRYTLYIAREFPQRRAHDYHELGFLEAESVPALLQALSARKEINDAVNIQITDVTDLNLQPT